MISQRMSRPGVTAQGPRGGPLETVVSKIFRSFGVAAALVRLSLIDPSPVA
jgi:hypothetical protein